MCYIDARYRQQYIYVDDTSSASGRGIPQNTTTAELKQLVTTLNLIGFWLKHFQHNYQQILILYHDAMIELFKNSNYDIQKLFKIKNNQLLLIDIGSSSYMKKMSKKLPPL